MKSEKKWRPPDFSKPGSGRLGEIRERFEALYPSNSYGDLAPEISRYWISMLAGVWAGKVDKVKAKDLNYSPDDPLSRIAQKSVVIAYADSVREKGEPTLNTLDGFLASCFPAIGGLHILPPCEMSEKRFNDGGFSQIRRDRIHGPYGSNALFESLMEKYFSMTDLVLNHVDIEHPAFQQYLGGDDRAGECFFVFSEAEYLKRRAEGDFDKIFRPRPFPLFTIFRKRPLGESLPRTNVQRFSALNQRFRGQGLASLSHELIHILSIFQKVLNDQMLLDTDYGGITGFRRFLGRAANLNPDDLFVVSKTQETRHTPYIFNAAIGNIDGFLTTVLPRLGITASHAAAYAGVLSDADTEIFGEPIRALTTFSHVQVDLNTTTFEGLKLLIDDFSWYLKMDLNMLRLDAANFAFKKWGTSCFGLPEVNKLLKIIYLSMECVSPRTVPNLEVNAPLGSVLKQMADRQAPPPMMYDFHLAGMLPVVFNSGDARPLLKIFEMINLFDIPPESIRFSLDESHDGKSVSGSGGADRLLTYTQRKVLEEEVLKNGGHVKFKSTPKRRFLRIEFEKVCEESGLDPSFAGPALFKDFLGGAATVHLKDAIGDLADMAGVLDIDPDRMVTNAALRFFADKIFDGREPYELCISTRDALTRLDSPALEARRYLAFKTLAFALMGRHVKSVYFNDLMGLKNDHELVESSGELRNIKRTKSDRNALERLVGEGKNNEHRIARQMNNTIALVDADPASHPRGNEAVVTVPPEQPAIALVHNFRDSDHTLVVVNTGDKNRRITFEPADYGLDSGEDLFDQITGKRLPGTRTAGNITLEIEPFGRLWLKTTSVDIDEKLLVRVGPEE